MTKETHQNCRICSQLKDVETGYSKYGWPENDVPLPAAYRELVPDSEETKYDKNHVLKCPLCGTRYHYQEDYTYLAPGSEDEITLTRLIASDSSSSSPQDGLGNKPLL